jgi:hypothetical protein
MTYQGIPIFRSVDVTEKEKFYIYWYWYER